MADFTGFSKETLEFYRDLRNNNRKEWFAVNRDCYDTFVIAPARKFVLALGERLAAIADDIHAEPMINRSIFKIHRDVRFSRDKAPFKDHLGLWIWQGEGPRMECAGFYFHGEPDSIMLGAGVYRFSKEQLRAYRDALVHPVHGDALKKVIQKLSSNKKLSLGGLHYKRVPREYDPGHPMAELLKHNGLYCGMEMAIPDEFFSDRFVDFCFKRYQEMQPLNDWLYALIMRMRD